MRCNHAASERRHIVMAEFAPSGGLFQFALQLGEGLARRGDRVDIVTGFRPEARSRESGCTVFGVLPTWHPTAGAGVPEWWRRFRRVVRGVRYHLAWLQLLGWLALTRPDVVLWSAWRFPVDGWGVRLTRLLLPRAALALLAHEPRPLVEQPGSDGLYRTDGALVRALAGGYRVLDAAFVLGDEARRVLMLNWPIQAPVSVIPHGNEDLFADVAPPAVDATRPTVLFFGTITAYKGLDDLLDAWPAVRAMVGEAELVIAGHVGADIDGELLAARVEAMSGVTLRAGYVPMEQVADLFGAARVVALPYRRSSQSGVAHLAFTFGRPVVATAVGDIPAVVRDGRSGLLVEANDPDALADALVRVLLDGGLAGRLGAAGRADLDAGADWDQVAAAVASGLAMAAGARPRVPTDGAE